MPINAMIPKAIMATVRPVRKLLLRTVRQASETESRVVISSVIELYKDKLLAISYQRLARETFKKMFCAQLWLLGNQLTVNTNNWL
jgi:hypothetical protein